MHCQELKSVLSTKLRNLQTKFSPMTDSETDTADKQQMDIDETDMEFFQDSISPQVLIVYSKIEYTNDQLLNK